MKRFLWDAIFLLTGSLFTYGQVQENSTSTPVNYPLAAAVHSHFGDCPDSHSQFCFHGTCRFLVQEDTPACVCHAGFVGMRCEHADLLAVVATNQKQQTVATLLVLCVIGSAMLILFFSLVHCCRRRGLCSPGRAVLRCHTEKHSAFLTDSASCCPSETASSSGSPTLSLKCHFKASRNFYGC
ncbi:protransforming growth factor alpha isoform X1 [Paramormyrops kingsleyae]|uniref:protransforming growth factor alpha isoform X1 n=1 Tax=Paramormyrops kingsleyae TaxID=1676925 RepID=UPI000CD5CA88|nr:protransforming growth factor alpha isoform X1 [Paramormyrops kingsleyae]